MSVKTELTRSIKHLEELIRCLNTEWDNDLHVKELRTRLPEFKRDLDRLLAIADETPPGKSSLYLVPDPDTTNKLTKEE